ncbi:MAG: hypothetical protein U0T11_00210 [Chitinophagaceae bacterium]
MSNNLKIESHDYLRSLYRYLNGDLEQFQRLCTEIEMKEITDKGIPDLNLGSMFNPNELDKYYRNETFFENEDHFRLTIPITLSLMAVIDLLGYLTGDNDNPLETKKKFQEFFKVRPNNFNHFYIDILNDVFRQGLVHVYFPKLNLGIKYHSSNPKGKLFFINTKSNIFLNVNELEEIVIQTFRYILSNLNEFESIETRYQKMINDYKKRLAPKVSDLLGHLVIE